MAVIALDMGGTKIEGAVVLPDGTTALNCRNLLAGATGREVAEIAAATARKLIDEAHVLDIEVTAVGVCVPGIVYSETGTVWAPNVPGWECFPLHHFLTSALPGLPVYIDSDRSCAIYGETWTGVAAEARNAVFFAVGTGIGLGIKIDGHVIHGHSDIAGAAGWMALQTPAELKYKACGCFEYYASGNGIGARARGLIRDGAEGCRLPGSKPVEQITSHDVFDAYDHGDAIATSVLHKAVKMWGMASANIVSLLNPEVIIWGGGVFGPAVRFIDDIRAEAALWAQPVAMGQVRYVASHASGNPILQGAAYIALNGKQ